MSESKVRALDIRELTGRAQAALTARFEGAEVTEVDQFIGGASSLTYSARLRDGDTDSRIVIKAAPPGLDPVRNRDVLRQARLFEILGPVHGIEVPEVLGSDLGEPPDVPPLFIMSYVDGESYEPVVSPHSSNASPAEIAARAHGAARMAAVLHAVDTGDPCLSSEKVVDLTGEVARWDRAFGSVADDLKPGADEVRDALLARVPDALDPSILHGDWRLGNMQCTGSSINAVIDWEIWSLGDRRLDIAWFLLMVDPGHPNVVRTDTGLPAPDQLVATYEEAAGQTLEDLGWFGALVRYKQAAVSALIVKNNRKLPQPGVDIDRMLRGIPRNLDRATEMLA